MNINLSDYTLVLPELIEKNEGFKKLIDIEVENDNTFFIKGENDMILSHNCDGFAIAAQLMNFFNKYWPELFEYKMIYKAETPIVVIKNYKTNKKVNFYTQSEFIDWMDKNSNKDWEISYKKGLSALDPDEYEEIIKHPKLVQIKKDEFSDKKLDVWFGSEPELRKNELI